MGADHERQAVGLCQRAKLFAKFEVSVTGKSGRATLESAECDIHVALESDRPGHIAGRHGLEGERPRSIPTMLRGYFEMDQSYHSELEKRVMRLATSVDGYIY